MLQYLAQPLFRLASWLDGKGKAIPGRQLVSSSRSPSFVDAYRRHREPTSSELLAELKSTAWTCASINAAVCASHPPRLYVTTQGSEPTPRCLTRGISPVRLDFLRRRPDLSVRLKGAERIEEVVEHPLLNLLQQVNPVHNGFDLWELTQFYLEIVGCAYWYVEMNSLLEIPDSLWILPAQRVFPRRNPGSKNLVDVYELHGGNEIHRIPTQSIIAFRVPDPRDPYTSGLSPLRACYEQVALGSQYAAMKRAIYDNTGIPNVVLSPSEVISEEERERLELQWNQKFRRGGAGQVLVSDSGLKVDILSHSMGDLAALADLKANKEDIVNAFHVPMPFLSGDTNLANMQAADHLHKTIAIRPRLRRRDEKLNEQLVPLYDPTGRLFLMSDDPTPAMQDHQLKMQELDLKYGVRTINELRSERGLPPVPWGDRPKTSPVS